MIKRFSALDNNYKKSKFNFDEKNSLKFTEVNDLLLYQVSVWTNTLNSVGSKISKNLGLENYPGPNKVSSNNKFAMLRTEPLKWWVFGSKINGLSEEEGNILDLSHSRTCLSISGEKSSIFLNRFLSLDLRDKYFTGNSVASTTFHHVGVTLWNSENDYKIFIPRAFALSLWEIFLETATQFNYEVN